MAKRKRRNAITLASLLLALAALIGIYVWYDNRNNLDTNEDTETISLAFVDKEQVSTLHYQKDDTDLILTLREDQWISKEDPERPMNQDYIERMLDQLKEIKAERVIMENSSNLSDYGLDHPSSLIVSLEDGATVTVKIGNVAGDNEGYYGLVNADNTVYLLSSDLGLALQYNNTEMTAVAESPKITATDINHIIISQRNGEDYELKYNPDSFLDNSGSSLYSWEILKPYGKGYTADSSKITEVQSNYTGFQYIECVDYKGDDLSKYGLKEPAASIYIGYTVERTEKLEQTEKDPETGEEITEKTVQEPKNYQVYIGDKNEEGNYYIRIEGSNSVYTISGDDMDHKLTIDAFDIMNPYVALPSIKQVDHIEAVCAGKTFTMDIKNTADKNSDGEEEALDYYYNGNKVEEEAFKVLYNKLISITYDKEMKESVPSEGLEPYMTLSFRLKDENGTKISASFLPYNDSFYIVEKKDGARFYADKRLVDDVFYNLFNLYE